VVMNHFKSVLCLDQLHKAKKLVSRDKVSPKVIRGGGMNQYIPGWKSWNVLAQSIQGYKPFLFPVV